MCRTSLHSPGSQMGQLMLSFAKTAGLIVYQVDLETK